jgi:hypothetical protein
MSDYKGIGSGVLPGYACTARLPGWKKPRVTGALSPAVLGGELWENAAIHLLSWLLILGLAILWIISKRDLNPSVVHGGILGFLLCLPITARRYRQMLPGVLWDSIGPLSKLRQKRHLRLVPFRSTACISREDIRHLPPETLQTASQENSQYKETVAAANFAASPKSRIEIISSLAVFAIATCMVPTIANGFAVLALYGTIFFLQLSDLMILLEATRLGLDNAQNNPMYRKSGNRKFPNVARVMCGHRIGRSLSSELGIERGISQKRYISQRQSERHLGVEGNLDRPNDAFKITQRVLRGVWQDGGERIEAELWTEFGPEVQLRILHLAFCPPFGGVPRVQVEQLEGPPARVRLAQLFPHGVRIEVKLHGQPEKDSSVRLRVYAFGSPLGGNVAPKPPHPQVSELCRESSV